MEETPQTPSEPAPPEPPAAPEDSRFARWMRQAVRLTLGFLVILGLGMVLAIFAFYQPQAARLKLANQNIAGLEATLQASQEQAAQEIATLETRVNNLSGLETTNKTLETERDRALLHVTILRARVDVASALLALANDDPDKARVALNGTGETLKTLQSLLDAGQQQAAADMQARLELALQGIGNNANAAESDLGVLATDLLEMETAYFTGP